MICPYKHPAEITCAFCAPVDTPLVNMSDYIEQLDRAGRSLERFATIRSPDCEHQVGERCDGCPTYPILDLETYSRTGLHMPEPWRPTEAQILEAAGLSCRLGITEEQALNRVRNGRVKLQPGVVIDDEPVDASPVMAIVARWAAGIALVGAGAAIMYAEGARQAMPGVGFALGLSMLVGAVLLTVGRDRC